MMNKSMAYIKMRIAMILFFFVCGIGVMAQNRLSPLDANRQIQMDGMLKGILGEHAQFAYMSISRVNGVYGFYYNDSTKELIYVKYPMPLKSFKERTSIKYIEKEELAIPDTLAILLNKMYLYSVAASSYSYLPDKDEDVAYYFRQDIMSAFCGTPLKATINEHLIKISEQICQDIKGHHLERICAMGNFAHKLIAIYYDINPKDVNNALLYNRLLLYNCNNWDFDFDSQKKWKSTSVIIIGLGIIICCVFVLYRKRKKKK